MIIYQNIVKVDVLLAISIRLIKNDLNAPQIKLAFKLFRCNFQCGDGTIYRASGFKLTQINGKKWNYL